jgi:hypothetical protein
VLDGSKNKKFVPQLANKKINKSLSKSRALKNE